MSDFELPTTPSPFTSPPPPRPSPTRRRPGVAGLSSFVCPGLGNYYAGQPFRTALTLFAIARVWSVTSLIVLSRTLPWKLALPAAGGAALLASLVFTIIAIRAARRAPASLPAREFGSYAGFIGACVAVAFATAGVAEIPALMGAKNYNVPTSSMEPTIKVGDRVRCDLRAYASGQVPHRGDIVVFDYPKDPSVQYVKRVIGLPGESLRIRADVIHVDGHPLSLTPAPAEQDEVLRDIGDDPSIKRLFHEANDGRDHWVLYNIPAAVKDQSHDWPKDAAAFVVPEGTVFVIGDNRDNSTDSRVYGPVALAALKGRVVGVVYNRAGGLRFHWDRFLMDID